MVRIRADAGAHNSPAPREKPSAGAALAEAFRRPDTGMALLKGLALTAAAAILVALFVFREPPGSSQTPELPSEFVVDERYSFGDQTFAFGHPGGTKLPGLGKLDDHAIGHGLDWIVEQNGRQRTVARAKRTMVEGSPQYSFRDGVGNAIATLRRQACGTYALLDPEGHVIAQSKEARLSGPNSFTLVDPTGEPLVSITPRPIQSIINPNLGIKVLVPDVVPDAVVAMLPAFKTMAKDAPVGAGVAEHKHGKK